MAKIELVAFRAEHLKHILENGMQDQKLSKYIKPGDAERIEKMGSQHTILIDGEPVCVGGIFNYWENRGEAWLIIGQIKTTQFLAAFRVFQRAIFLNPLRRIEMTVDCAFKQGHRMAEMLGFEMEAPRLKRYRPDGGDVSLYALVRGMG